MECRFHDNRASLWHCPDCATGYCVDCIPGGEDNFARGEPRCPLCLRGLNYLGQGVEAPPFWQRSGELFRYGTKGAPLTGALLAGLLATLEPGFISFLLGLALLVVLLRYGLMVTVRLAAGDWQPPPLGDAIGGSLDLFFKQLALVLGLFLVPALVGFLGAPVVAGLMILFAMLALPAGIMLLAMSESLSMAFNPVAQFRMMTTIGWPYLLLWFALMAVTSAPGLVASLTADSPYHEVAAFMTEALSFYSTVVAYALMGYLLFQYGNELGLVSLQTRGRSLSADVYERKAALGLSHVYARSGRLEEALSTVERALRQQPLDTALHDRKHRLLRALKQHRKLMNHAREYCSLLARAGNPGNATAVLRDIWQKRPDYQLEDPAAALAIARVFHQQGCFREARKLLVNLHRRHPDFDELGQAYLLLARICLEGFDENDTAGKILRFLKKRDPAVLDSEEGRNLAGLVRT